MRYTQTAMERAVEEVNMSKAWRELSKRHHTIADRSIHEFTYIHPPSCWSILKDPEFNLLLRHHGHTQVWSLQISRLSHLLTGGGSPQPAPPPRSSLTSIQSLVAGVESNGEVTDYLTELQEADLKGGEGRGMTIMTAVWW